MTITEQALVPKNPAVRSEDGIVVTPDFVAVIDGSTSKSRLRCHRDYSLRRRSNGELAMSIVSTVIRKMPKDSSCHQFCLAATKAIHSRYKKSLLAHLAEHPEDRLTASAVVYSRLMRELWLVGDCQCLLGDQLIDNPKPAEQELASERAAIITASPVYKQWASAGGGPFTPALQQLCDEARRAIIPHMLETMRQQNIAYSVLDGFPVAERHVRIIALDFRPWQIVLASDGYPFLCTTLAESEARLQQQRLSDPLNIGPHFLATKAFIKGYNSFDDRAYIRFSV
ncbi:MAG: hypothetical protein IJT98_05625 [Prevotella sp.]|nr:hypothetical protein [Prevotella sp.]